MNKAITSISKTIRFPVELYNKLDSIAKESGNTFTNIVIEQLKGGQTVSISEGRRIAQLLFEIKGLLSYTDESETHARIGQVLDDLVDEIYKIRIHYQGEGGDVHGNT